VSAEFSKETTQVGDVHLVALTGELDMATAKGLTDWLVCIAGSPVIVDLSGLTFMDSSGISALVMARNRMVEDGNELILTRPHPIVSKTLNIVGLSDWVVDWDPRWGDVAESA
jgi:anti-sigma B factor antagonist